MSHQQKLTDLIQEFTDNILDIMSDPASMGAKTLQHAEIAGVLYQAGGNHPEVAALISKSMGALSQTSVTAYAERTRQDTPESETFYQQMQADLNKVITEVKTCKFKAIKAVDPKQINSPPPNVYQNGF